MRLSVRKCYAYVALCVIHIIYIVKVRHLSPSVRISELDVSEKAIPEGVFIHNLHKSIISLKQDDLRRTIKQINDKRPDFFVEQYEAGKVIIFQSSQDIISQDELQKLSQIDLRTTQKLIYPLSKEMKIMNGTSTVLEEEIQVLTLRLHSLARLAFKRYFNKERPSFQQIKVRWAVTRDGHLHYDYYNPSKDVVRNDAGSEAHVLRCMINLDTEDRVWNLGPEITGDLVSLEYSDIVRKGKCPSRKEIPSIVENINSKLRMRNVRLSRVKFSPGSVWFIEGRRRAHQVVSGKRGFTIDWWVEETEMKDGKAHTHELIKDQMAKLNDCKPILDPLKVQLFLHPNIDESPFEILTSKMFLEKIQTNFVTAYASGKVIVTEPILQSKYLFSSWSEGIDAQEYSAIVGSIEEVTQKVFREYFLNNCTSSSPSIRFLEKPFSADRKLHYDYRRNSGDKMLRAIFNVADDFMEIAIGSGAYVLKNPQKNCSDILSQAIQGTGTRIRKNRSHLPINSLNKYRHYVRIPSSGGIYIDTTVTEHQVIKASSAIVYDTFVKDACIPTCTASL